MNQFSIDRVALPFVFVVFAALCGCRGSLESDHLSAAGDRTLVGQLILPSGPGSRGVEVLMTVAPIDGEPRTVWVLFDDQGRFSHTFQETLTSVEVTTGMREIYRIDAGELPEANQAGQIELGAIKLLDRLVRHRLVLRAADDEPSGDVRIGLWFGPPPVGPRGEPVSLGSRQFPEIVLGSELEWLLPHDARDVFFLVERPVGASRGAEWRSGELSLFGPFTSADIPAELVLE